jgi:hypothetical protein
VYKKEIRKVRVRKMEGFLPCWGELALGDTELGAEALVKLLLLEHGSTPMFTICEL